MSNEITIPFAGQKMSGAFAALVPLVSGPEAESLADGIGSSYPVISYKGKTWSLRYRGDRNLFKRADDGSPMNYIDVIILRQARAKSKSYYKDYVEGEEGKRPICASLDGIVPDRDVLVKQSDSCGICPRNEWKKNAEGKNTRECSDYKRLAVLIVPSLTKAILGAPLLEPAFLRVPPASLNALGLFGDTMAGQGYHYSSFVTRIRFDADAATPKFVFSPLQILSDKEAPVVLKMRDDLQAKRITGEDAESGNRPLLQAPATPAAGVTTVPEKATTAAVAVSAVTVKPAAPANAAPKPATTNSTSTTKSPSEVPSESVDLGFGASDGGDAQMRKDLNAGGAHGGTPERGVLDLTDETSPSVLVPTGEAAVQTAADVGETTESDADIDAKIAKLLRV